MDATAGLCLAFGSDAFVVHADGTLRNAGSALVNEAVAENRPGLTGAAPPGR